MSRTSLLAALGRILIAVLFIVGDIGKIDASAATQGYIASVGLPFPLLSYLLAVAVELGGGILLLVGYRTRLVSLVIAAFTLATALAFHNDFADPNQMTHFLKNLAIVGGLLQVAAFGAGVIGLDGRRSLRAA